MLGTRRPGAGHRPSARGATTTDEHFDLAGAVAVVTGATRGIGKQVAFELGRAGARLVLVGRTRADRPNPVLAGTLDSVAAELEALGVETRLVQADLTDADQTREVVTQTLDWHGRCDVLVNNAAYTSNGPVLQVPWHRWEKAMRAQVVAPLQLVQGLVPGMLDRGAGRVVNISSEAASTLAPNLALYSVSKLAMERLTEYLHLELGGRGVSFNALHVERLVSTEGWKYVYDTQGEEIANMGVPLSEMVSPELLGRQVRWLVERPADWSGHVVSCREVTALGG
jgi:NAD(P)-dependent dehydrogenase (short-subunit alcohol dehydrogenase family)